jgi:hypothetical protein
MEKRSRRRVPELVTRLAFQGLSENEIGRGADIHDGQERKRSVQGPDTEAQDLSPSKSSARISLTLPWHVLVRELACANTHP